MRFIRVETTVSLAVVLLALAAINAPLALYSALSSDKEFLPETRVEIAVFRVLLACLGIAVLFLLLVWFFAKDSPWRKALEQDFRAYVTSEAEYPAQRANKTLVRVWLGIVALVFIGILATIYASFTYQDQGNFWFDIVALEDGVWEMGSALCLLVGGLFLLCGSYRLWKRQRRLARVIAPAVLGLALCLAAGEEASWGQRWLGYETPELIKTVNVQGEFTVHNIGGRWANQVMMLFFVGYIGGAPILARFFVDVRYLLDRLNIPLGPLSLTPFAFVGVLMDERDVFRRLWGNPPWYLDEGRETVFAVAILAISVCWFFSTAQPLARSKT